MVSVGESKLCYTNSIFVDPGVKVNGAYYRDVLLSQQLLPAIRQVSGVLNLWVLNRSVFSKTVPQRTGRARRSTSFSVRLLHSSRQICGPLYNNPDHSPVDYQIWGISESRQIWGSVLWLMFGLVFNKALFTMPLSDTGVSILAFRP